MSVECWGSMLVVLCSILSTASVILYAVHPRSRKKWYHDVVGRHLMAYMLAIALVLDLSALRIIAGTSLEVEWFVIVRLCAFSLVPVVLGWRLVIIIHVLFGKDPSDYTRTDK